MKPTLVIMAAGIGSRYGGLKQIDPVGPEGEIVLDYSVYDAVRAGFGKVVFIIRPEIENEFKEVMGGRLNGIMPVEYVFQTLDQLPSGFSVPDGRTKPWGTGQAVLCVRGAVQEPFAVINADDFYGRESFEVLAGQLRKTDPDRTDFCMVGFFVKNTLSAHGGVARGFCQVEQGRLVTVAERFQVQRTAHGEIVYEAGGVQKKMEDDAVVSMNAWGFTPRLFDFLEDGFRTFLSQHGAELKSEYLLPAVIDSMIRRGQTSVAVLPTRETWMGITYSDDKPQVAAGIRTLIDKGIYPADLWSDRGKFINTDV